MGIYYCSVAYSIMSFPKIGSLKYSANVTNFKCRALTKHLGGISKGTDVKGLTADNLCYTGAKYLDKLSHEIT